MEAEATVVGAAAGFTAAVVEAAVSTVAPTVLGIPTVADIPPAAATMAGIPPVATVPMEACAAAHLRRAIPAQPEVGPGRAEVMVTPRPDGIRSDEPAPAEAWRRLMGAWLLPIRQLPTDDSTPSAAATAP